MGHWRPKVDARLEILAGLDADSEAYAELAKQVQRDLQPAPDMAPAELTERADLACRCRQLLPGQPWPLVYELAARFWAGDRAGAQRLLPEVKSDHLGFACEAALLSALARCFLERRQWKEAAHLYRKIKGNSAFAAEAEAVLALAQTPRGNQSRNPLTPQWKEGLDALVQRHAALEASV